MARRAVTNWGDVDKIVHSVELSKLCRALPVQWTGPVRALLGRVPDGVPVWQQSGAMVEQVRAFAEKHGDAATWNLADSDVVARAESLAKDCEQLIAAWPDATAAQRLDVARMVCEKVGVPEPVAITGEGAVARVQAARWWRAQLRRKVARVVEQGAIRLGMVSRTAGAYASDGAVARRSAQKARNAAMLERAVMVNEAGQFYTLAELAAVSVSNPAIRGGELMTRIRGCEEHADAQGHVGTFWTLTAPSAFHPVNAGGKTSRASRPRPNPNYDGKSTPIDAQLWLRKMWSRSRAQLAREGINVYGFRVAEPHHDGTPHWHAMLWTETQAHADRLLEVVRGHWLSEYASERGAQDHRLQCKAMRPGGAAGYCAKYVAKSIGHVDVGDHIDTVDGMQAVVWAGDVQGWQRVDAWAATWGIRQFQAIGQPSVTVWRLMRRVTKDQVEQARQQGDGRAAWQAFGAVHKVGDIAASWARYIAAQGGVCLARAAYRLATAVHLVPKVNGYGEAHQFRQVMGVRLQSGRVLVTARQLWKRAAEKVVQDKAERARMGAPWTGFNNCTARLTGQLRAAMMGLKTQGQGAAWG